MNRMETRNVRYFGHPEAGPGTTPLAATAGDLVFCAGCMAVHPERGIPEGIEPFDGYPHHWSRVNRELGYIFDIMEKVLGQAGSSLRHSLKINSFHTHPEDIFEALRMRPEIFGDEPPPSTLVMAPELPVRGARAAIDLIAATQSASPAREAFFTSTANAPMPPHQRIWGKRIYAKASRAGGFIFTSGRTNNVIGGQDDSTARGNPDLPYAIDRAEATCRMVINYLRDVLESLGCDVRHVVRAEIHLSDMTQIAGIERVWTEIFPDDPPARIFIPSGFPTTYTTLEIEFIALDPKGPWDRENLSAVGEAPAKGHEPAAVRAGPYVFYSGLSAHDGRNGLAEEARVDPAYPFHENRYQKEANYILARLPSEMSILRRRVMGPDLSCLPAIDAAWLETFGRLPPTTSTRTSEPLPVPSTGFQLDLIGWLGRTS